MALLIVNLDKAPRTANGMVGFSSPFYILKPVDMARGSHKIFYRAMIFHARCLLDTTANINGMWHDRFDRATDILRI